ncbi:hypothetical protein [Alicyclobacillus macrosporangiidus]|uniref:hypothetical protein n=1 Tax=Alicyclobacillus macrosporangiidus TaxID=392015 RepID=UPI0026E96EE4|nr:hypothetical protein [Alicyclobacillus macrosporangiidus]
MAWAGSLFLTTLVLVLWRRQGHGIGWTSSGAATSAVLNNDGAILILTPVDCRRCASSGWMRGARSVRARQRLRRRHHVADAGDQ